MKTILTAVICLMVIASGLEACVTYNKSTNTYTVDNNGHVRHGSNGKTKSHKSKYNR